MNLKEMRWRIELLAAVEVSDSLGGRKRTYGPLSPPVKLWAARSQQRTAERSSADQHAGNRREKFTIWKRSGINHSMRLRLYDNQTIYEIVGIDDSDLLFLSLECEALRLP